LVIDDHQRAKKNHARILSGEALTEVEYRCLYKDGTHLWVLWNVRLISGESSIYLVGRDITKRRRTEQTFQDLLESAPDAMVVINDDWTIVLVNAQLERLFGYSRHELLGNTTEMLVPQQFRADHPPKVDEFISESRVRPLAAGLELQGERKDGSVFPVEVSLSLVETEDGRLFSSTIRDVSDRDADLQ